MGLVAWADIRGRVINDIGMCVGFLMAAYYMSSRKTFNGICIVQTGDTDNAMAFNR